MQLALAAGARGQAIARDGGGGGCEVGAHGGAGVLQLLASHVQRPWQQVIARESGWKRRWLQGTIRSFLEKQKDKNYDWYFPATTITVELILKEA